MVSMSLSFVTI